MTDPYKELANAIILQGVKDYREAGKKLKKRPKNGNIKPMVKDCERFFCSEWFGALSNLDGRALLKRLKEEDIK